MIFSKVEVHSNDGKRRSKNAKCRSGTIKFENCDIIIGSSQLRLRCVCVAKAHPLRCYTAKHGKSSVIAAECGYCSASGLRRNAVKYLLDRKNSWYSYEVNMTELEIRQAIAQHLQDNLISLQCAYAIVNVMPPSQAGHSIQVGVNLQGNQPNNFDDLAYRAKIERLVQQSHDLNVMLTPVVI